MPCNRLYFLRFALRPLAWFAVVLVTIVVATAGHARWWTIIPLGLVERGLALTGLTCGFHLR
jgi:hypothetical protein